MPSSTSSSERLTAADRPGVAQPVPERPVPPQPWNRIFLFVLVVVVLATLAWEWRMRDLGLVTQDYEDGPSMWAEQRRRVDAERVEVALIGDSRLLFDTDLERFEQLTGVRPLQLSLPGTNARPFLEDLAADADFRGLVILGLADLSYFRPEIGLMRGALERYDFESPAQRSSQVLGEVLSHFAAFADENYRLSLLVQRLDLGVREGTRGPYQDPWKLRVTQLDRQCWLWPRVASDPFHNAHARAQWMQTAALPPVRDEVVQMTLEKSAAAVSAIRARGGEVIFIRPPSAGALRDAETRRLSRERGWDQLLIATGVDGLHFEDDPVASQLQPAELSHLTKECATVYTDAYVRGVARLTSRLKLRPDAPPPLGANDCPKPPIPP